MSTTKCIRLDKLARLCEHSRNMSTPTRMPYIVTAMLLAQHPNSECLRSLHAILCVFVGGRRWYCEVRWYAGRAFDPTGYVLGAEKEEGRPEGRPASPTPTTSD